MQAARFSAGCKHSKHCWGGKSVEERDHSMISYQLWVHKLWVQTPGFPLLLSKIQAIKGKVTLLVKVTR